MKIQISGICGFAGSQLAKELVNQAWVSSISGIDNLSRKGSWNNLKPLESIGVQVRHADIRSQADMQQLEPADWFIDAAAIPTVLAGTHGDSRSLIEHNLLGTINSLEYCKRVGAGIILLSSSRVYSIDALRSIPLVTRDSAFAVAAEADNHSSAGIVESFPTSSPVSLYGASKLASEVLVNEYAETFQIPAWINRCGVIAGAGQFGKADQGIFSFWLHSWREKRPLKYLGFDGTGYQTRDFLHARDLAQLVAQQLRHPAQSNRTFHISGGQDSACSLNQLSSWCTERWGERKIEAICETRQFDVPWLVLDSQQAIETFAWTPKIRLRQIFEETAEFADEHPNWLESVS